MPAVVPGGYGYGMDTRAAYGGGVAPVILRVTNLNDSGAGSLRVALEVTAPRVVIFETSGTINLATDITLDGPQYSYLIVAGQTAPSPGITLRYHGIALFNMHDAVLQHFRIRPGWTGANCNSAFQAWYGADKIVLDHMSLSWGQDENCGISGSNMTLWRSIMSEGLLAPSGSGSCGGGGASNGHGTLAYFGSQNISILQNLYAHNLERNPYIQAASTSYVANNLIYDPHEGTFYSDNYPELGGYYYNLFASLIGNYYKRGSNAASPYGDFAVGCRHVQAGSQLYEADTTIDNGGYPALTPFIVVNGDGIDPHVGSPPVTPPVGYTPMSSADTYAFVLANAGARPFDRDSVDTRIIADVQNRTGTNIATQDAVGGWPSLAVNVASFSVPENPHTVQPSGYTALEEALHASAAAVEGSTSIAALQVPSSSWPSSYWRLRFSDDFAYANQAAFEAAYAPGLFDDVTGARDVLYSATNGPGGIPGILADDTGTLELNDLSRAVTGSLQKPIFILEGVEYRITGVFDNSLDFIRLKAYWIDEPSVGNDDLSTYFVGVFSGKAIVGAAYDDLTVQVRTGASHITTHVVGVIPTSGLYEIDVQFKLSDTGAGYVKVYINETLHYNYTGSVYDTGYPLLLNYVEVSPGGRFGTYRIYDRAAQTSPPTPGTLIDNSVAEGCCAVPGGSHAGPVPISVVPASWYRTCTGGGQASSADDVVESENWVAGGVPLHPDSWLTILGPPSDPDLSDVKWGLKPLSDRDRFVEGRLSDVGEIERGSSDKDGHYTPARLRVVQQDDDAVLREKLADPSEHVFLHREARLEILSYEGRKASGSPATAPRPLLQGRVVSTQPELERRGVIEIQDIVGSQYSPLDPEKMIGLLVGSEHPNLPETSKGKIYNIFFGERSDAGAIDATGASASKGVLPVVDCGDGFLNNELPEVFNIYLAALTDKAGVNVVGAGDITFPTRVLVSVVINGVIGPPSNVPTGFLNDQGNGLGGPSDAHAHREVWMAAPGVVDEYIAWFFTNPAFHPVTNPTGDPNVRFKTVSGTPTYPAFPPRSGFPSVWDFYVDFSGLTDGEPWGVQTTSSPQDLQATVNGTPGTTRYVYAVSAITTYGETRPSTPVVVTNGPAVLTATDFISLSWTAPQDNPDAVITYRVLGRRDDPPTKYLAFLDSGSPMGSGLSGSPVVDLEYNDTGADPETPFNISNQNALASENVWGWLACGQGWGDIHEVYGSDLADGAEPKRVLLDMNDGDLLTPTSTEWPHASAYRIVGDIQQYGFYARGTRLQHHRDGIVTFAWNGCGFTDTDSPPLLINQAAPMLVSFLNEFVEKQNGVGYRSGTFGPIEAFADGTPKFWTSKFDVYQQATIDRMGNDLGWIGSLLVTEPMSLREILRQFFTDFAGHLTTNHRGQIYPFLIAPVDVSPVEGDIIRERMEISRLLAHRYAYDELENRVTVSYLHDADANEYRVTNQVFQDAASIAAHGGGALGTHDGGTKECRYSNDADTVADRWAYHLELYGYPPRYVDVLLGLAALERPNGARVRFTHRKEGIGANGETLTPGVVVATKTHVQPYQVTQTIRLIAAQTFGLLQDEDIMAGNLGDENALLQPPDGAFRLGPG